MEHREAATMVSNNRAATMISNNRAAPAMISNLETAKVNQILYSCRVMLRQILIMCSVP